MAADIRPTSKVTRDNLLRAGMELLAEKGYEGAITRTIALRAGVTEQTLYRHFESKDKLLIAGITKLTERLLDILVEPTDNLLEDLLWLANGLSNKNGDVENIVNIIPELDRHLNLLNDTAHGNLESFSNGLKSFFRHYKESGELIDIPSEELIAEFVGPLISRSLFSRVFDVSTLSNNEGHVMHFLGGYRK